MFSFISWHYITLDFNCPGLKQNIMIALGGVGVDTSMGFTPLSGVMMGSRSGDKGININIK